MNLLFSEHAKEICQSIIDYNPDGIVVFSMEGKIIDINQAVVSILGYSMEELKDLSYTDFFDPKKLPIVNHYVDLIKQGIPCEYQVDATCKNGEIVHLDIKNVPLFLEGKMSGVFAIAKDITALKRTEEALRKSEERYRMIAENMTDLVAIWDVSGIVKYASPSHRQVLGIEAKELEGKFAIDFVFPDDIPSVKKKFKRMIQTKESEVSELRCKHVDGQVIWIEARANPILDEAGNLLHFLVMARDITERKLFEEQLNILAYHDPLTGIANRRLFQENLEQQIKEAKRYQRKLAVIYLDLDKFKPINDAFGHDIGDELLKQLSQRVQGCLRESDILARQGGDEFTILLSEIHNEEEALLIGERILMKLQEPWYLGKHAVQTTSSVGIAIYPTDGETALELMKNADIALYEAKESGRNRVQLYLK